MFELSLKKSFLIIFQEGDVLELIQVNDIRPGKIPLVILYYFYSYRYYFSSCNKSLFVIYSLKFQHPGISSTLRPRHGENIAEKSITVCSGLDMVNINLTHFVFANKEEADVSIMYIWQFLAILISREKR